MISMNRPSRGERESATTTRYVGLRVVPVRLSRIETATSSPPQCGKAWKPRPGQLALQPLELLHHLAELRVLLEQPVDVLHAGAAAAGDALAAAAVDDLGMAALLGRHGADDGVEAGEICLLGAELPGGALEQLAERQHAEDLIERSHLADLLELVAKILQREGVLAELAHQLLGRLLIDGLLRLLHQRQHVAHPQDPRGDAVGVEGLQRLRLLAHPDERDRAARDLAAAARAGRRRGRPAGRRACGAGPWPRGDRCRRRPGPDAGPAWRRDGRAWPTSSSCPSLAGRSA